MGFCPYDLGYAAFAVPLLHGTNAWAHLEQCLEAKPDRCSGLASRGKLFQHGGRHGIFCIEAASCRSLH